MGVPASKIDANDDLSAFLFHSGYVTFDGAAFSARGYGSFAFDRASGAARKINVADHEGAMTFYPSYLPGERVVYCALGREHPEAVVARLKRVAVGSR
jgi:hypothetical protein